jgi:hypothetical protein
MTNIQSHLHMREYWGELDAGPLVLWLNKAGEQNALTRLIRLNGEGRSDEIRQDVAKFVRWHHIAFAPAVLSVADDRWEIEWRMVGSMTPVSRKTRRLFGLGATRPAFGLAFIALLRLADRGLLGRVRKCDRQECGRWFYARFNHQLFHSRPCQERTYRTDPAWKKKHAEQMKRLRHGKKLQEQVWLRTTERKGSL